jgi:hypothetical protein
VPSVLNASAVTGKNKPAGGDEDLMKKLSSLFIFSAVKFDSWQVWTNDRKLFAALKY